MNTLNTRIASRLIHFAESGQLPDKLIRFGIRALSKKRLQQEHLNHPARATEQFNAVLNQLANSPVAIATEEANEQHYELPTEFFQSVLGKHLKYSACEFTDNATLDEAEAHSLACYCQRAELADGMNILELGCGWGSFTLWMASHYPNASITAVSNSNSQREYIMREAEQRGLTNITVITQDINALELDSNTFDRAVSVEMFEHVRNYEKLFENISAWLKPSGKLWCHIFCHRHLQYPFEDLSELDWMSRYFFTGGMMPSFFTFYAFSSHLTIEKTWQWSGETYKHTANAWLKNMDQAQDSLRPMFNTVYKEESNIWWQRWRIFFMSCAELFGLHKGSEWVIGHYLFTPNK
ncbi:MAG: class I SAM-dependent methyltransferase [Pseudomonadota bacterium]